MRIYADTSFLVSFLYLGDIAHAGARGAFRQHASDDWLTSSWSQIETINSLRQLCLAGADAPRIEAMARFFKHLHRAGPFELIETSCEDAFRDCQQLSAAFGSQMRMRSADVLHVALLEQINPDLFLTRDKDQGALAKARGFETVVVK